MLWKIFLVFSYQVLYTTSAPTQMTNHYRIDIQQLKHLLGTLKIDCQSSFVQDINLTFIANQDEAIPDTFCQISKVLAECHGTDSDMQLQQFQNLVNKIKGNATCQLPENGIQITVETFLARLMSYLTSLDILPPN